jgi:hypothetical protein
MKYFKFLFTALLVLGLVIGAYALTTATASVSKTECCCKDSCPMKNKDASKTAGDNSGCCGDSCPMKSKDGGGKENASGCCSCCGDSCPMKSKDNSASGGKKDCCEGKESCPMKKKENG